MLRGSTCFNINSVGNSKSAYSLNIVERAEDPAACLRSSQPHWEAGYIQQRGSRGSQQFSVRSDRIDGIGGPEGLKEQKTNVVCRYFSGHKVKTWRANDSDFWSRARMNSQ